jgi:hypothetical protein
MSAFAQDTFTALVRDEGLVVALGPLASVASTAPAVPSLKPASLAPTAPPAKPASAAAKPTWWQRLLGRGRRP